VELGESKGFERGNEPVVGEDVEVGVAEENVFVGVSWKVICGRGADGGIGGERLSDAIAEVLKIDGRR
jgi:hypothetical protein